jgi:hypothetical protein
MAVAAKAKNNQSQNGFAARSTPRFNRKLNGNSESLKQAGRVGKWMDKRNPVLKCSVRLLDRWGTQEGDLLAWAERSGSSRYRSLGVMRHRQFKLGHYRNERKSGQQPSSEVNSLLRLAYFLHFTSDTTWQC